MTHSLRNDTAEQVVVTWCVVPSHYSAQGAHDDAAADHRYKTHTLNIGEVLTYDDSAANASVIEAAASPLTEV